MLLVCHSTFSWSSLRLFGRIPTSDLLTIILVSCVTVARDLAQAVGCGVVLSALTFAWKQSTNIAATRSEGAELATYEVGREEEQKEELKSWCTYAVKGPLFFGSTQNFATRESPDSTV